MFCRECGYELAEQAMICTRCGVQYPRVAGNRFCDSCGMQTSATAKFCLACGTSVKHLSCKDKSRWVAGMLGIFLGCCGCHRFYLGFKAEGTTRLVLSVCTLGLALPVTMVWGIVEGIQILTGQLKDVDGNDLRK